jgi:hypothetical protein
MPRPFSLVHFSRSLSVPKEDYSKFNDYWKEKRTKMLSKIRDYTGLKWKKNKRVSVHIKPASKKDVLGEMDPSKPYDITLYMESDNRKNLSTMAHELVHSIVWSNYQEDLRWREIRLFEDIFADELLTELISQKVCIKLNIGRRKYIDYSWAIHYGFMTTFQRVADIIGLDLPKGFRRRWGMDRRKQPFGVKSFRGETMLILVHWSRGYFRRVLKGRITAMEARREVVKLMPCLSDYFAKELFFT